MKGNSIAGRKVNDGIDFYATPDWAVDKILEVADLQGTTLEPCSGAGAFAKKIPNCIASDIRIDDDVYGKKGIDLFSFKENVVDNIITNPPYCIAEESIRHFLKVARKKSICSIKTFIFGKRRKKRFF